MEKEPGLTGRESDLEIWFSDRHDKQRVGKGIAQTLRMVSHEDDEVGSTRERPAWRIAIHDGSSSSATGKA